MTSSVLWILLCIVLVGVSLYVALTWFYRNRFKELQQFKDDFAQQIQAVERLRDDWEKNQSRRDAEQEKKLQETIHQALQVPKIPTVTKTEPLLKTFYMPLPNRDGSFHAQASSEQFKPTVSVYKFQEMTPGKAQFSFESDAEGIRDVLNFSASYIQPVCEELNDVRPDSKQIHTVKPGVAERQGDKWMITQKAEIKYE